MEYYLSWWNLENLFDTENASRSDKLKRIVARELKGWNKKILDKKLSQLSKIISLMNSGNGPDILGVCEVENKRLIQQLIKKLDLPSRSYKIAHDDSNDGRGIDIAFVYDSKKFTMTKQFSQWIMKRNATRDLFQVNFKIKNSKTEFVLIGNHWPARIGGIYETEPYRILAGESLSYFHERIVEIMGKNTPILVMGDFNDQPFNRSIMDYALATNNSKKLKKARKPKLYNLMWGLLEKGGATYHYAEGGNFGSISDFKSFLFGNSNLSIKKESVIIEQFSEMSKRGKPKRFGRPNKGLNVSGFSDHFPIALTMMQE